MFNLEYLLCFCKLLMQDTYKLLLVRGTNITMRHILALEVSVTFEVPFVEQ